MRNGWIAALLALVLLLCVEAAPAEEAGSLAAMRAEQATLEAERGVKHYFWTIDEKYALHDKYRGAVEAMPGYTAGPGLPGDADMPLAEALEMARDAIMDKYENHMLVPMQDTQYAISFLLHKDGRHTWEIDFVLGPEESPFVTYHTEIDALGGELLAVGREEHR